MNESKVTIQKNVKQRILASCGNKQQATTEENTGLQLEVKIDGSSNIYPISEAVAEDFGKKNA
ncbi:MAG: hypothetical protein NTY88_12850 [Bacteroidetes bacterium]|nr:hypothetical protein [Bacteroidota bacterium]